ncbi:hypothetical protein SAMN05192549_12064 [Duganella sacchari]|uniref:Uncharacterized protein n=1 Tax=Duganella sacchari TaxID=551987 RepID=A0A1M7RDF6_9BURK|nr:hypothetical protein [Duganella sacchari]SHN44169.1 hypothetical protein SAMN05192549_12064 [Duganella sacchari]
MEPNKTDKDEAIFNSTMKSLEAQITNVGAHLSIDTRARLLYIQEIKNMSDKLRADAISHRISWAAAARQAQETRNLIMGIIRARSTPVGRAFAESMKQKGYSLNQLIALKTVQLNGEQALFSRLSITKQNAVYASIVTSAGRSNAYVSRAMAGAAYAGRGLLFVAIALSTYKIATSSNKAATFQKELAVNGVSVAGGIAGGALAGLACGPAAPICVTVGAFVGGALAAFATANYW